MTPAATDTSRSVSTQIPLSSTPTIEPLASQNAIPTSSPTLDQNVVNTPVPSPTSEATVIPSVVVSQTTALLIDHTTIGSFDQIPENFIKDAASLKLMFRGSSIAYNINFGLDCLSNNFQDRRPYACSEFYDPKYDRSNWIFLLRGNPGWIDKVKDFTEQTNSLSDQYEVFTFLVDYADGGDQMTYPKISDAENFQKYYVEPRSALEAQHPEKIFIWTTMSLARLGSDNEEKFNQMLREYAASHNKILFDLADIESHSPDGIKTLDNNGHEIIYDGYTDEKQAGHLNRAGTEVVAKAIWVLMSRIAGWDGMTK